MFKISIFFPSYLNIWSGFSLGFSLLVQVQLWLMPGECSWFLHFLLNRTLPKIPFSFFSLFYKRSFSCNLFSAFHYQSLREAAKNIVICYQRIVVVLHNRLYLYIIVCPSFVSFFACLFGLWQNLFVNNLAPMEGLSLFCRIAVSFCLFL